MKRLLLAAVAAIVFAGSAAVLAQQQAATPAPATPAQTFTARCSGCHGSDLNGGRAPSLFDHALLSQRTDDQLRQMILNGDPAVDMPAFKGVLSLDEINVLIAYMRVQGGITRPLPVFNPDPNGQVLKTQKQNVRIEVLATGLDTPWGAAFLPDGRLLVTERAGRIRILDREGRMLPEPVKNTPVAWVRQDGGYFDIAVHPDYAKNGWIYLSYSEIVPGYSGPMPPPGIGGVPPGSPPLPPSNTRIVRGKLNADNEWVEQQDVAKLPNATYGPSIIHYGQRFLFDGKGYLFWTLGDRGIPATGQDLSVPMSKIYRVHDDGSIPKDNPFVNLGGAYPSIWSYGHRNPQGLAIDPRTGLMWETEHGPTGGDEINIVEKGKDYGWAVVSDGVQPGITSRTAPLMVPPILSFTPSVGPSGIHFYTANRYPGWRNSLFVSTMVGQRLLRMEVSGRRILSQETIYENFGRTRQVITGPDGLLYILLQNPTGRGTSAPTYAPAPGMVIRLQPVN